MNDNLTKHGGWNVGYYNVSVSMIGLICDKLDIDIDSYAKKIRYKWIDSSHLNSILDYRSIMKNLL